MSPASPSLASLWIFARYSDGELRARECGLLDFVNPEGKKMAQITSNAYFSIFLKGEKKQKYHIFIITGK